MMFELYMNTCSGHKWGMVILVVVVVVVVAVIAVVVVVVVVVGDDGCTMDCRRSLVRSTFYRGPTQPLL